MSAIFLKKFTASPLVLFGTPPLGMPPEMDKAFLPNAAMPFLFQQKLSDSEIILLAEAMTNNENIEKLKKEIKLTDGNARSFLATSVGKGLFKNEINLVENLSVPIAILHGKADSFINLQYINQLTIPTLWKNKIQLINNTCHCPQLENSAVFNGMITDFYNSIF